MADLECDVLIVGGGAGGCAAAMAACSLGMRVILTEPTTMLGGQLTAQMVPPDEHPWIEEFGCTARYRAYREKVRAVFGKAATPEARSIKFLNPGGGWVSRLCHTPATGLAALNSLLSEARGTGTLDVRLSTEPAAANVRGDTLTSITIETEGRREEVHAHYFLDATELGEVLPLAGAEYRTGSESRVEHSEPHATDLPEPENVQGFTWCFALGFDRGGDHRIARPADFERWKAYIPPGWPGPLLSLVFPNPVTGQPRELPLIGANPEDRATLFTYRQIVDPSLLPAAARAEPVTCVNWPQNDYFGGSVIDVPDSVKSKRLAESKSLGLSLLYWLQTGAPRHDGGLGYPELTPRGSVSEAADGFAVAPYHRESRRMVTRLTVTEPMVAADLNPGRDRAPEMPKSVGVGYYRIDLHPSANGHGYIDIPALPFQIPLGALIPVRIRNLLPACKNLGVTHITNGCYRLHPVEWNVGEAAGLLAAFCVTHKVEPAEVYETESLWLDFQRLVHAQGIETAWPDVELNVPT
ncbi:MAG TPA: FAD-dependent oxidoreductase [Fimbriimonadaceae bacterium]|nr:FAD-dependent oxidoreductase [Fimbriimonadaceae bacterium]